MQQQSRTGLTNTVSMKAPSSGSQLTMSPLMIYVDSELSSNKSSGTVTRTSGLVTGNKQNNSQCLHCILLGV